MLLQNAGHPRARPRQLMLAGILLLAVASCGDQALRASAGTSAGATIPDAQVAQCRDALAEAHAEDGTGLDPGSIRLLNWNVHKRGDAAWRQDFDRLTGDADFILMQEASLDPSADTTFAAGRYWTFAPGYRTARGVTGVLTLSREEPLARCNFVSREPWLRSPKATSISEYAVAGIPQTLVVVNIHALNFVLGLSDYAAQLDRVLEVLRDHDGPIILAGDFNTWRGRRMNILTNLADSLGLHAVSFADDERLRVFGQPLDHIYVRDLEPLASETVAVHTSDHNPMTAVLGMPVAGSWNRSF